MRTLQNLGVVSSIALSASLAPAQDAVQWRVEDGGNGHWYQLVTPTSRLSMTDATAGSISVGGHLASIGSSAENDFIYELASLDASLWTLAWPGATQITGPWIGASYIQDQWTWIDGSTWGFTSWAPTEPNYLFEETAVLFMGPAGGAPTRLWNNIQPDYLNWGYVIEWSTDCNSDGMVDYGQILNGELDDADGDNIPDCCEQATACSTTPVEWSSAIGGNGHWYQLVIPSSRIDASEASLNARARGGELASVTSSAENNFIFSLASSDQSLWTLAWPGATQITGPWIGAHYNGEAWTWLDASVWSFSNWAPSEPNYLFEETAVLYMGSAGGPPTPMWNNIQPDYLNWGYVVEWSTDCNSDGLIDFGQIRAGTLVDADFNGVPDCCEGTGPCDRCRADVDHSGAVDGADLAAILNNWGTSGGKQPRSDVNGDGIVDGADLAEVLNSWGACP